MGCGASKPHTVIEPAATVAALETPQTLETFCGPVPLGCRRSASSVASNASTRVPQRTASSKSAQVAESVADVAGSDGDVPLEHLASSGVVAAAVVSHNDSVIIGDMMAGVGKATGEALVELAKTLPFIAPVAFLICAVASSAATAVVLRNDCMTFAKVLCTVEDILLRAQNLESTGAIDDVREVLQDALALMDSAQTRGFLTSTLLAKAEKNRFEELKNKLHESLGRLNLSATLELAQMHQAKFGQMEQMRCKVQELGGPNSVLNNPKSLKEIEQEMEAADQLLMASVAQTRAEIQTVGNAVGKTHWETVQIAVEQVFDCTRWHIHDS